MKRLIQWRPYYLQHQSEAPPPLLPLALTCALSLTFFLFQHSPLSALSFLFFFNSLSLYPLDLSLPFTLEICTPAGEASVRSKLCQFNDKGLAICTDNGTNNVDELQWLQWAYTTLEGLNQ